MPFHCPVAEQRFVLDHVVRIGELTNDADLVNAVLEGAAAFAEGEVEPLNRTGDTVGARWQDGEVAMPEGFHQAYQGFVQGGWSTISAPEASSFSKVASRSGVASMSIV